MGDFGKEGNGVCWRTIVTNTFRGKYQEEAKARRLCKEHNSPIKTRGRGNIIDHLTLGDQKTMFHQVSHRNEQGSLSHAQLHKENEQPSLQIYSTQLEHLHEKIERKCWSLTILLKWKVKKLCIDKPPNASPMHCKPMQTPNSGIEGPSSRTVCKDIPESWGVPVLSYIYFFLKKRRIFRHA